MKLVKITITGEIDLDTLVLPKGREAALEDLKDPEIATRVLLEGSVSEVTITEL